MEFKKQNKGKKDNKKNPTNSFILFIYSRETHRKKQRHRQGEKQAPCGDSDVGLHPEILGRSFTTEPSRHPTQVLNYRELMVSREEVGGQVK